VQVEPTKRALKAPGIKRLQLICDEPLSDLAFKFKLRHYTEGTAATSHGISRALLLHRDAAKTAWHFHISACREYFLGDALVVQMDFNDKKYSG
jgi:uncharacterized protein YqkB